MSQIFKASYKFSNLQIFLIVQHIFTTFKISLPSSATWKGQKRNKPNKIKLRKKIKQQHEHTRGVQQTEIYGFSTRCRRTFLKTHPSIGRPLILDKYAPNKKLCEHFPTTYPRNAKTTPFSHLGQFRRAKSGKTARINNRLMTMC